MAISSIGYFLLYWAFLLACLFSEVAYGIYAYQGHYFANPINRWWGAHLPSLRYSFICALFIFASYVIQREKYAHNKIGNFPQLKWFAAMVVMCSIVTFYALWKEVHIENLNTYIKLFLFVLIAYKVIDTPNKIEKMLWVHIAGTFYIGWLGHTYGRTAYGRLEDIGPVDGVNANDTASVLITAIPILIYYLIHGRHWQRFVALIALAYTIDGIVLINSRGAFVGLFCATAYFSYHLIFCRERSVSQRFLYLFVLFFSTLLFLYLTDITFWQRMVTLQDIDFSGQGSGGASRLFFWLKAVELAKEYPFGMGYWGFQYLSPQIIPAEYLTEGMRAIHSTYFQALSVYGYLGPVLLGLFILSSFRLSWKIQKTLKNEKIGKEHDQIVAISSGFLGFLVAATFIDRLFAEMMYWFPLYIACFYNVYVIQERVPTQEV